MSRTLHGDGGYLLDALLRERFEHPPDNQVIDMLFLFREVERLLARNEQGVVVGHFRIIHAMSGGVFYQRQVFFPLCVSSEGGEQFRQLLIHVFGDITASRPRIGDELALVQPLGDGECLFRRVAELDIGFLLQGSKVEEQWGVLRLLLAFQCGDSGT